MGLLASILGWLADKLGGRVLDGTLDKPTLRLRVNTSPAGQADGQPIGAELTVTARAMGADVTISVARIETDSGTVVPVTDFVNADIGEDEPASLMLPFTIPEGQVRRFSVPLRPVEAALGGSGSSAQKQRVRCRFFVRDERRDVEASQAFTVTSV